MSTEDFLSSPRFNFKKYLLPATYMPGTLGNTTKPKTDSAQPSESWQSRWLKKLLLREGLGLRWANSDATRESQRQKGPATSHHV